LVAQRKEKKKNIGAIDFPFPFVKSRLLQLSHQLSYLKQRKQRTGGDRHEPTGIGLFCRVYEFRGNGE
jgi:hypothetical protein